MTVNVVGALTNTTVGTAATCTTYQWEEAQGNTKYKYNGAGKTSFVLPLLQGMTIVSQNRVRNTLCVEIRSEHGSTRFRLGERTLGKLLLIARLLGIPVEAAHQDGRRAEWDWALLSPWTSAAVSARSS